LDYYELITLLGKIGKFQKGILPEGAEDKGGY